MDLGLTDKSVLITGAGTGIGEAVAKRFAAEGARVVCAGLPDDPVDAVAREINESGGTAVAYGGDLAEPAHAEAAVQKALDAFGSLYCVANVAGVIQVTGEHQDIAPEDFDYMYRHQIRHALLVTKYALSHLQRARGNVIFTGSETAGVGQPECAIYGGSKGFLVAFAQGLALEQAKHGVRANTVCPGPTESQWHDVEASAMTQEMEDQIKPAVPLGRRANPEEIANVYAFVASERATFVTGATYYVDGGLLIARGTPGEQVPTALARQPKDKLQLDLRHTHEGLDAQPEGVRPHRAE